MASAAILLLVALAGCGSSPTADNDSGRKTSKELTAVLEAVKGLGPHEREAKLAQLAKREGGKVTVYHTLNARVMTPLSKDLEDKYGLKVSSFDTSASDLLQRVGQETKAKLAEVDVVETGGPEMYAMASGGTFADYRSSFQAQLGPGAIQKGWTTDRFSNFTIAWNTKRVKPGELPKSWEELAEPKWKGRISLSSGTVGVSVYKTLRDNWVKTGRHSAAEADDLFKRMARNALAIPETNQALQLLAAGDQDVAVGVGGGSVDGIKDEGAPVEWKPPMQPIVRLRGGAGLVRDAPHPASALLFMDYLLSKGQDVLAAEHRDPAREDLETAPNAKFLVVDLDKLAPEQQKWTERWDKIVGLARQGKE